MGIFSSIFGGDNFTGHRTLTFPDGYKYVGEYKDGKYHGQGTETDANGRVAEGMWRNGELLE